MHRNVRLTLALVANLLLTGSGLLFYRRYLFAILYFIPFVALRWSFLPELGPLQFSLLARGLLLIASYVHIIILHRRLLRDRSDGETEMLTQTNSFRSKGLALLFQILQGIGVAAWLLGGILMVGWYIAWLDAHLLWRYLASLVGILTIPLIPIAVLIEWVWHGWPTEITWWFSMSWSGMVFSALAGFARRSLLGQTVD